MINCTIDTAPFSAALRETLANTRRAAAEVINSRMFFLAARAYVNLPPKSPQAERDKIRSDLTNQLADRGRVTKKGRYLRFAKIRQLQSRHKIIQAIRARHGEKGLYGQAMRDAAGKFLRGRIARVGYLKAAMVLIMRKFSIYQKFSQYNAATTQLAKDAGYAIGQAGRVATFKGITGDTNTASVYSPDPRAEFSLTIKIADGQEDNVGALYNTALGKAFADETTEMQQHLLKRLEQSAE